VQLAGEIAALYEAIGDRIEGMVGAARERVAVWQWARPFPLPHRREPLLHERLWLPRGQLLDAPPSIVNGHERYGWAASGDLALYLTEASTLPDGLPAGRSLSSPWPDGSWYDGGEIVLADEGLVVCAAFAESHRNGRWRFRFDGLVRYRFDGGRVIASEYLGYAGDDPESGFERYLYDAAGSLVAIDEYEGLLNTTPDYGTREDLIPAGGMLEVRQAKDPERLTILSGDDIVWRPAPASWSQLLEQRADEAARACQAAIAAWAAQYPERATRPVLAVQLDDYTQATPCAAVKVAFERPHRHGHASHWADLEPVSNTIDFDDQEGTLLRVGASAGEDVQTAISEAVVRRLRAFDWDGILTLSDDLLVYADRSENDPGECVASARRVNPPDVVDRWVARGWLTTD
jgi:hypothetical protein